MERDESHRSKERGAKDDRDISEEMCVSFVHCWMEIEDNGKKEGRYVKEEESRHQCGRGSEVTTR